MHSLNLKYPKLLLIKHANSFLVSGKFCHLLIIFANCLDPDPEQQNIGPNSGSNQFDTLIVNNFFEKS